MKFFSKIRQAGDFCKSLDIKSTSFILPAVFSILASLFEGISIGLLIPLLNGLVSMDFHFVKGSYLFRIIAGAIPGISIISNNVILILLLGIIFSTAVLKNILQYLAAVITSGQLRKISDGIRKKIFGNYLSFGKMFFDRNNLGYLYSVLINYTTVVIDTIKNAGTLFGALFMIITYIMVMLMINWKATLFVSIMFPLINYVSKKIVRRIKNTSEAYEVSLGEISKKISNILSCMPLVKLYTREKNEFHHFSRMSGQIRQIEYSLDKKQNLVGPMQEIFFLTAIILLVSVIAFVSTGQKSSEIASFLVFFFILKRMQASFLTFGTFAASLAGVDGQIKAISKILDGDGKFIIVDGKTKFNGLKNSIEFKNLSFSYSSDRQILKEISVFIEKGKITAIVGPTGSGKTTLINLILRFYDCPASALMIDGIDIRKLTFESLRAHMALVSQDTLLFNDNIKNNIKYGLDREVSEKELIDVIKKARLYDFIAGLPDGLDTFIGDKGVKLSGGEKQRVSIARALLKGSEILILDEATSSLDTRTERLIQEAINEAIKERTAIVIAHRLSTIKNADKIIFMDDGRIAEEGTLDGLLQKKGRFYESWQEQKFY